MKWIVIVISVIVFVSCDDDEKSKKPLLKAKFDAIEKIVGNDNWTAVKGTDTLGFYFSRTGDDHINVYLYRMVKGDSTGTAIAEMYAIKNEHVFWIWGKQMSLLLKTVNDTAINWVDIKTEKKFTITKIDSTHLGFIAAGEKTVVMTKTLPLATFLVRARYDYEHGTSYVDSPLVKPRKPVILK